MELFRTLIGPKVAKKLLPPISYNGESQTNLLHDPFDSGCHLCNPENWEGDDWGGYTSWGQHCFAHKLIFEIGISAKKRDISWRKSGKYTELDVTKMFQIEAITILDLNSLGVMFQNKRGTLEDRLLEIRKASDLMPNGGRLFLKF